MQTNTNTVSSDNLRELLAKALAVYDTPEECVQSAIAFIDGLKVGATSKEVKISKELKGAKQ